MALQLFLLCYSWHPRGVWEPEEVGQHSGMSPVGRRATLYPSQHQPVNWANPAHAHEGQASSITAMGATEWQNVGCVQELENIWEPWKNHLCVSSWKGGTNYNLLVCMSRIRDLIQILSVLCTQKNEVILLKTLTLWEDWRLPSLAARTSSWLCSQHTSCIYAADWDWFQDFPWSALVLSLQGIFSAFHYSLMNAATHHLPEEQNCWSVTWL